MENIDFVIENGVLKKYQGDGGDVVIPHEVTSIGDSAFSGCKSLTGITIPDTVTSIGRWAFDCCGSLKSITIPASVTSIGSLAFDCCESLKSITMPDTVTSIENNAFYGCKSLKSITIPDSVTSIGDRAFFGCASLKSITIPDSVTSIGDSAFSGCKSLNGITITDSIKSIGDAAFNECGKLQYNEYGDGLYLGSKNNPYLVLIRAKSRSITTFEINDKTKYIHSNAFDCCNLLTSITIPDSVTSIGGSAFRDCRTLTSISIPGGVEKIGYGLFSGCSALESIGLNDGIKEIEDNTFGKCISLKSITIPSSVKEIDNSGYYGIFSDCNSLECIKYNGWDSTVEEALPVDHRERLKDAYIVGFLSLLNEGVVFEKEVEDNYKKLLNTDKNKRFLRLCKNTQYVEYCVKNKLITLKGIDNAIAKEQEENDTEAVAVLLDVKNRLFSAEYVEKAKEKAIERELNKNPFSLKELKKLWSITPPNYNGEVYIKAYKGEETEVTVPYEFDEFKVAGIDENAKFPQTVTKVILSEGIKEIRDRGFYASDYFGAIHHSLSSIVIPSSMTSIGKEAFRDCAYLTKITIPDSVNKIGYRAFSVCPVLSEIEVGENNKTYKSIDGNLYSKNGKELIQYATGKAENRFVIPDGVTNIGKSAFRSSKLKEVTISATVTNIEDYSFSYCGALKSLIIPDGVVSIKRGAFTECCSLKTITIPTTVTSIGVEVFAGCKKLTITAPKGSYAIEYAKENNIKHVEI